MYEYYVVAFILCILLIPQVEYEVRFDLTDTLFCLTKYELVRTTKFTRLVLPILYVLISHPR